MGDDQVVEIPLPTPDVFPFPYPTPYTIQVDLMRTVYVAIEQKKIAIVCPLLVLSSLSLMFADVKVESPTGTGKSLTLLTSTLTWLQQNQKRVDEEAEQALRIRLQADDPDGKSPSAAK
jgi:chromosome transmission fidelity protein 1